MRQIVKIHPPILVLTEGLVCHFSTNRRIN